MKTLDEPTVENGTPRLAYGLLTDLYQLTMAQGYWENDKLGEQACFTVFFRDAPFPRAASPLHAACRSSRK